MHPQNPTFSIANGSQNTPIFHPKLAPFSPKIAPTFTQTNPALNLNFPPNKKIELLE